MCNVTQSSMSVTQSTYLLSEVEIKYGNSSTELTGAIPIVIKAKSHAFKDIMRK